MIQLNPPIPVDTPKGAGFAHIVRDDSHEDDMFWTVIITETGEFWQFPNKSIRAQKNITLGRIKPTPFPNVEEPIRV